MIQIHPQVLQILAKLQRVGPAYVVGGYLRDHLCGFPPNDVDIATELTIAQVKEIFPNLSGTQQGLDFGIGRFQVGQMQIEISTYDPGELLSSVIKRDFTINALYHDGKTLTDPHGAKEDISKKVIRSLEVPEIHFANHPQAYLRAIRLSSQLGFSISDDLLSFMKMTTFAFDANNSNRIQQEGYKILMSPYPFKAFHYLMELGLIQKELSFDPDVKVSEKPDNVHIKVAYFASVIGLDAVTQFIEKFQLSKKMFEKLHLLTPYIFTDIIPAHPFVLNEVILLKRLQYTNEPQKMQQFLTNMRNSKT